MMRLLVLVSIFFYLVSLNNAMAELVSVSMDFEYAFASGPFDTVVGNVQFTVDNSESVVGTPVAIVSFSNPVGHFATNDVMLDFRQGDDTNFPTNPYEFEIYFSEFSVFSNQPGDFLISAAAGSLNPGDTFGNELMSSNFFYYSQGSFLLSQNDINDVTVTQAIPEPSLAGILNIGLVTFLMACRRRRTQKS